VWFGNVGWSDGEARFVFRGDRVFGAVIIICRVLCGWIFVGEEWFGGSNESELL